MDSIYFFKHSEILWKIVLEHQSKWFEWFIEVVKLIMIM